MTGMQATRRPPARSENEMSPARCTKPIACEKPPPFKLPQNLVPYFTTDRANYFDAKYKSEDFKTLDEWGKAADNFGIYDYAYGAPYPLPREIGREIAAGIARAHRAGARLYYAELNPIFAYDAKKCAEIFAALENPCVFTFSKGNPCDLAERHLDLELRYRALAQAFSRLTPEEATVLTFRKHLFRYFKGLPGANALRGRLMDLHTIADLRAAIATFR